MPRWNSQPDPAPRYAPLHASKDDGPPRPDDLYARWAEATDWRGFSRVNSQRAGLRAGDRDAPANGHDRAAGADFDVRIIAKAPSLEALELALKSSELNVPDLYRQAVPGAKGQQSLYFTASVRRKDLPWLYGNTLKLRWELAMPLHRAESVAQATTAGRYGPEREAASLIPQPLVKVAPENVKPTKAGSIESAIAIIDVGCPFLNRRFARGDGGSRIVTLWDQDNQRPVLADRGWVEPSCTGYGRELNRLAIDNDIVPGVNSAQPPLDEAAFYRSIDYLIAYDDARRRTMFATHGSHVMDTAAGRHDPLTNPHGLAPTTDKAGQADIIFVQLPALTAADSSGGSLGANVLDAVRYAMHVCKKEAKLVINVSYGSFAGPHDGSSLVEEALDDLLEPRRDRLAIVLAAGNARQAQCHVRRTVHKDKSALLRFAITPADTTDTFLELWYPRPGKANGALAARVRSAGRDWSPWVCGGKEVLLEDEATKEPMALLQHQHRVPNGNKAMVLLSLVPTSAAIDDVGPLSEPGLWEMEVGLTEKASKESKEVTFDAWIERDDPEDSNGLGGASQPSFLGLDFDDDRNTLSSIATGAHTVVVGGYRRSDASLAPYSSLPADGVKRGPKRTSLPFLLAPCEEDALQPTLQAAAVRSDDTCRMNGTSIAAPVVTRRLFNLLAAGSPATNGSWAAVLKRLAADSDGVIRLAQD